MAERPMPTLVNRHDESDTRPSSREVRVLLAEDSATIRHYLANLINETPGMRVVGEAKDGEQALSLVPQLKPDVISMDIRMPGIDGLEATRRIMMECPTPVVVVSGLVETDIELSFQALQAGALAVCEKPPDRNNPAFAEKQRQLIRTLMAMASVSVVRRGKTAPIITDENSQPDVRAVRPAVITPEIIAIGASAGGPSALSQLLSSFPPDLKVPVVIVQHIPQEFVHGLARWLSETSTLPVQIAADSMVLSPGVVNLSPGMAHLSVIRRGDSLVTRLIHEQGAYRYQPAVDVLFESVAAACGAAAVGVVLTGMGDDGAAGLLAMRRVWARTFAQDERSSTVFGMPGAAIERGAVEHVLPLGNLASAIVKLL